MNLTFRLWQTEQKFVAEQNIIPVNWRNITRWWDHCAYAVYHFGNVKEELVLYTGVELKSTVNKSLLSGQKNGSTWQLQLPVGTDGINVLAWSDSPLSAS